VDELVPVLGPAVGAAVPAVAVLLAPSVTQDHADVNRPVNRRRHTGSDDAAVAAVTN